MPTHDPELIEILLRVRDNLHQGKLPQPPFLSKHPRRGYHHPLALSPHGFPSEYFLHEGLPHDYAENPEEEITEELLLPIRHQTEEDSEFTWPVQANQTLEALLEGIPLDSVETVNNPWNMLFNPTEEGKTIEELLTGEATLHIPPPVSSGIEVESHPEEILQRRSELKRNRQRPSIVKNSEINSHLSHSLWDSFVSTLTNPPTQKVHRETLQ